jgi:hypothetical protein
MPLYVNDGSAGAPGLLLYLNLANLDGLRPGSAWPGLTGPARHARLRADGFDGVQCVDGASIEPDAVIRHAGSDRVNTPADADRVVAAHRGFGHDCLTLHAGWGLEDDDDLFRLVEAILATSERHGLPVFIETHRATITQDLWRTVQITKRFPQVRFNGDFSHYYTGQEMVYGGLDMKCAFMAPIFARVGFMHGRIGSPGCMQVSIGDGQGRPQTAYGVANFLDHFRELWTLAMLGFLRSAGPGDQLIFCPELLAGTHYYARLFPDASGNLVEESDRYQQALLYQQIARGCFREAQRRAQGTTA